MAIFNSYFDITRGYIAIIYYHPIQQCQRLCHAPNSPSPRTSPHLALWGDPPAQRQHRLPSAAPSDHWKLHHLRGHHATAIGPEILVPNSWGSSCVEHAPPNRSPWFLMQKSTSESRVPRLACLGNSLWTIWNIIVGKETWRVRMR